ncbi:hypothetical protein [Rhizobium sp. 1399]|uniref:hypothetical protein n=1 Tax=Rhizobium sp. 1399 TaxID=2817758 RepID=UPI0028649626|nr:hypothetical protein [Rhizobium sp. 1399]MDR6666380.1 hypothetical protein [Rhizobium sp. 1399]
MDGSTEPTRLLRVKFLAIFVCSWFLLGFLSSAVVAVFNFVPSAEWVAETNRLRTIAGSMSAVLFVWGVWKGGKQLQGKKLTRVLTVIISPLLDYFVGGNILLVWPLLLPLIAGHEVALPFTVQGATGHGARNCRTPVDLEDMPFLIDRVCNVPESIRSSLTPGIGVLVLGWGTRLGVCAREVSLTSTGPEF